MKIKQVLIDCNTIIGDFYILLSVTPYSSIEIENFLYQVGFLDDKLLLIKRQILYFENMENCILAKLKYDYIGNIIEDIYNDDY